MEVTIAILITILTMLTFLIIVSICVFIKLFKKGWVRIGFDTPKEADAILDELEKEL